MVPQPLLSVDLDAELRKCVDGLPESIFPGPRLPYGSTPHLFSKFICPVVFLGRRRYLMISRKLAAAKPSPN